MAPTLPLPALPGPSQAPGQPASHLPRLFLRTRQLLPVLPTMVPFPMSPPLSKPGLITVPACSETPASSPLSPGPRQTARPWVLSFLPFPSRAKGLAWSRSNTWLLWKGSLLRPSPASSSECPLLLPQAVSPIRWGTLEDLWRQKLLPPADPESRDEISAIRREVTETKDCAPLPPRSASDQRLEEKC